MPASRWILVAAVLGTAAVLVAADELVEGGASPLYEMLDGGDYLVGHGEARMRNGKVVITCEQAGIPPLDMRVDFRSWRASYEFEIDPQSARLVGARLRAADIPVEEARADVYAYIQKKYAPRSVYGMEFELIVSPHWEGKAVASAVVRSRQICFWDDSTPLGHDSARPVGPSYPPVPWYDKGYKGWYTYESWLPMVPLVGPSGQELLSLDSRPAQVGPWAATRIDLKPTMIPELLKNRMKLLPEEVVSTGFTRIAHGIYQPQIDKWKNKGFGYESDEGPVGVEELVDPVSSGDTGVPGSSSSR